MNFTIPEGLSEMLRDFTVAVLRARPSNLYQFAADYFSKTATTNGKTTISVDYSPPGGATNGPAATTTTMTSTGLSNSVDHHTEQQQQQPGAGDESERSADVGSTKVVPMYIVVDDDDEAREPDKSELRPKTSRQHRYGRRHSVSAERYDPEADDDTDENKVSSIIQQYFSLSLVFSLSICLYIYIYIFIYLRLCFSTDLTIAR